MSRKNRASQEKSRPDITSFARVVPYVWPYRRRLYLSILFAGLVALFWGISLSLVFPVVKVLLQGESVSEYIEQGIAAAERDEQKRSNRITKIDTRLELIKDDTAQESNRNTLLKDRSREQSRLSESTFKVWILNLVKSHVLPWLPNDKFDLFSLILFTLLISTILKGLCIFVQDVLVGSAVELTVMGIRKDCFRKTLALDYQTLTHNGTSELMSRFTFDMNMLVYGLRLMGGKVVREPLKALVCISLAFWVSWRLTLLSMLLAPLAAFVFYRIGKKLKEASHRVMESMSRIYQILEETFDGMKIVIAFNSGMRQRQRFHQANKSYFYKALKIVRIDALTSPTTEALGILALLAAVMPGAYLVLRETSTILGIKLTSHTMDIAELSLLYGCMTGIVDPARKLSSVYTKLKRSTAASDRIFELMDKQTLVTETTTPQKMPRHEREIEFQKIEFAYATGVQTGGSNEHKVIDDLSLKVQAGEVVVIVGENGSGKSTLVNLLPRFFDPSHGAILIDGVDTRDVKLQDLRSQIGIVTQETQLFNDTIFNNILIGQPGATSTEVEQAARRAHVMPFLENRERFPDGLQTEVGSKGGQLSGGQRQRIALARAILRNPSILILDEATSAIDANSELLIHETLLEFVKGRTTFIITHSVNQSILNLVTRIIVMEHGQLVASGTHQELINSSPVYQRLFQSQVKQQSVDESPQKNDVSSDIPAQNTEHSQQESDPQIFSIDTARKQKDGEVA